MSTNLNRKAARTVAETLPSQVAAWRSLSQSDASSLVTAVSQAARHDDDPDTVSHAVMVAAGLWQGNALKAARAALNIARRDVSAARTEIAVGLSEIIGDDETDPTHSTLSQWGTSPADSRYRTTAGDLVDVAATLAGPDALALVKAYRAHAQGCTTCEAPTAGRRPTLAGIPTHVAGVTKRADGATYDRLTRGASRALASVPTFGDVCSHLADPAPLAERVRTSRATGGDRTPRTSQGPAEVTVTMRVDAMGYPAHYGYGPAVETVTVTRAMTGAESETMTARAEKNARWSGEEYGVTTAPNLRDVSETTGMLKAFKPVVSPRKRPGGQTGPTVPAF